MKKLYYKIKSKILTIFGDIKVFKFPCFFLYNPKGFDIKGDDIEDIMNIINDDTCIVLRAYNNYLDGWFIPVGASKCSHSGVFINGTVYHSMAEGVRRDSIIEFCRADRIIVLKPKKMSEKQVDSAFDHAEKSVGLPYDIDFNDSTDKYYCHEFTRSCFPKKWKIEQMKVKNKLGMSGPKTWVADSFYLSDNFEVVYEK